MKSLLFYEKNDGIWKSYQTKFVKLSVFTSVLCSIMIVLNSCIRIEHPVDDDSVSAEGYIKDIITNTPVVNATVKILEWHPGILWGAPYSIGKDSCTTDQSGHYSVSDEAKTKYDYTLEVTGSEYFRDEGYPLTVNVSNKVSIAVFPHGYIKTHLENRIDTAKFIEIFFTPFYNSEVIFRDGYINTYVLSKAYTDTSIITATVGGVTNRLLVKIYSDYVSDVRTVVDTSFLTCRHDTLRLDNIILE